MDNIQQVPSAGNVQKTPDKGNVSPGIQLRIIFGFMLEVRSVNNILVLDNTVNFN